MASFPRAKNWGYIQPNATPVHLTLTCHYGSNAQCEYSVVWNVNMIPCISENLSSTLQCWILWKVRFIDMDQSVVVDDRRGGQWCRGKLVTDALLSCHSPVPPTHLSQHHQKQVQWHIVQANAVQGDARQRIIINCQLAGIMKCQLAGDPACQVPKCWPLTTWHLGCVDT